VAEFAERYTNLHMQMSHGISTASSASFFGIRTQSADEVLEVVNIMMEEAQKVNEAPKVVNITVEDTWNIDKAPKVDITTVENPEK